MFYESDKIDKKFLCPVCNKRFDTPKSLPCGESLCEKCIANCIKKASTPKNDYKPEAIDCPLCDESHQIPKKGFPTQKLLLELLNLQPTKVFRGALFEKFETNMKNLSNELTNLKESIDESESRIKNHCEFIREDIDISTESIIDDLNKLRVKLMNEVDNYEKNSQESLIKEKKEMFEILKQAKEKYDFYMAQLKQPELDKDLLKNFSNEVNNLVIDLQKHKNEFESFIQIGKLIRFRPTKFKFKEKYLGLLNYEGADGELDIDVGNESDEIVEEENVWSEIEDENEDDGKAKSVQKENTGTVRLIPHPTGQKVRKFGKTYKKKTIPSNEECKQQ